MAIIIVTGAMGHLGNVLVRKLERTEHEIRGLALPGDRTVSFQRTKIYYGDVRDYNSLEPLFDNPEQEDMYVIHTAGIVSIASKYQQKVYDVNVRGTKNMIDRCLVNHVKKLVYVSSSHAIPEQEGGTVMREVSVFSPEWVEGLYAKTKAEASQLVLDNCQNGLNACVVHPSGLIGPEDFGHAHLTQMIQDYLNGRLTAYVDGGYDFVDVRDVADGILSCLQKGRSGECYLLTNRYCTVKELLDCLHQITGRREIHTKLPMWFAKAAAPMAEAYYKLLHQPPLYTSYSLYTLLSNGNFTHEKADRELSYQVRPMAQTLKDTAEWLAEQGRIKGKYVQRNAMAFKKRR